MQFRESSHYICPNSGAYRAFGKEEIYPNFGTGMAPFPRFWVFHFLCSHKYYSRGKIPQITFYKLLEKVIISSLEQNFEVKQTWWTLYSALKWHPFTHFPYYFSIFGTSPHWCREYDGPMLCEGNGVSRFLTMFSFEIQAEIEFKLGWAERWRIPLSMLRI